jgi:hypothetical protein
MWTSLLMPWVISRAGRLRKFTVRWKIFRSFFSTWNIFSGHRSTLKTRKSPAFLSGLFPDWPFEPWGEDYLMCIDTVHLGGGLMKTDKVDAGKSPSIYIEVEQIEPTWRIRSPLVAV